MHVDGHGCVTGASCKDSVRRWHSRCDYIFKELRKVLSLWKESNYKAKRQHGDQGKASCIARAQRTGQMRKGPVIEPRHQWGGSDPPAGFSSLAVGGWLSPWELTVRAVPSWTGKKTRIQILQKKGLEDTLSVMHFSLSKMKNTLTEPFVELHRVCKFSHPFPPPYSTSFFFFLLLICL